MSAGALRRSESLRPLWPHEHSMRSRGSFDSLRMHRKLEASTLLEARPRYRSNLDHFERISTTLAARLLGVSCSM